MPNSLSVAVVDDSQDKRETLRDELEFEEWQVEVFNGPYQSLDQLTTQVLGSTDVAVYDHHLVRNYASFNGAAGVAWLYRKQFPGILVTQYHRAQMIDIRLYRREVPVLLQLDETNPDSLARGWEICRDEFAGKYLPTRQSWRTSLRVDDVVEAMAYVLLPGWNSDEIITLPMEMFPAELHSHVRPGALFRASVNKGAEDQSELYFVSFEYRGG